MDFLTGNRDRHDDNVLVGPKGEMQLIDHAFAFSTDNHPDPERQEDGLDDARSGGPFNWSLFRKTNEFAYNHHPDTYNWWQRHKKPIVEAFQKHIDMIPDKEERARRKAFFDYRVNAIDNKHPVVFGDSIEKSEEELLKGAMQRLHPFTPRAPGISETYTKPINSWVGADEDSKAREQLGLIGMEPNARARALHKLHSSTEVRRNPSTSEREFLLHRGFSNSQVHTLKTPGTYDSTSPRTDKPAKKRALPYSSWSVDPEQAHTYDHMVSAFVPESKIAFYIPQYNKMPGVNRDTNELMEDEKEAIVSPGKFDIFHQGSGENWLQGLKEKLGQLHKSLGNASFLHDQHTQFSADPSMHANTSGVHERLMKAHPATVNPGVRHFEISINNNKIPVKPFKEQKDLEGLQPKALYKHNGKGYLVKAAHENSTSLGAWNEMTSQSLYHAGNIGHLHQKVHATVGKTGLNRSEPAHALAIHMEPDSMTFNDAAGYTGKGNIIHAAQDANRASLAINTPEHKQNLKKIGVMDYLLAQHDRHGGNLLVKPDGSVISIDGARSFWDDRKHAYGPEVDGELSDHTHGTDVSEFEKDPTYQNKWTNTWEDQMKDSGAAALGGMPDQETQDWWNRNKGPMLDRFKQHVAMLPEPEARQKMLNSFMVRYNRLGGLLKTAGQQPAQGVHLGNARTNVSEVRDPKVAMTTQREKR
jgi:hypothetical protein